jgi:hypothetical protein
MYQFLSLSQLSHEAGCLMGKHFAFFPEKDSRTSGKNLAHSTPETLFELLKEEGYRETPISISVQKVSQFRSQVLIRGQAELGEGL